MSETVISQKEQVRGKSVLLYSGGMDCLMMDKFLSPDVLLYVPSSKTYGAQESTSIEQLCKHGYLDKSKLVEVRNVLHLDRFERADLIVPARNAYLVLLAAHYGETIFLGATAGDRPADKNREFCARVEHLLNHLWQEQAWSEKREFAVEVPFKNKSKTQLVKQYMESGGCAHALLVSYSCYTGTPRPCGQCKACFRKWAALVNNNITIPDGYHTANPAESPWLGSDLSSLLTGRGQEGIEWVQALKKVGVV